MALDIGPMLEVGIVVGGGVVLQIIAGVGVWTGFRCVVVLEVGMV